MDDTASPPPDETPESPPAPEKVTKWPTKSRVKKKKIVRRPHRGRPTDYSQDIAQAICEKIAEGVIISKICEQEGFPAKGTFFRWVNEHEDFARAYALAKQCYAEDIFDENIGIADDIADDIAQSDDDDGTKNAKVRAAKLQIDTRFRTAARLAPRRYGDRAIDPLLPQVLPPDVDEEDDAESAKVVDGSNVTPLEHHPLYDQLKAWKKVGKGTP